jgi:hypothetical protein
LMLFSNGFEVNVLDPLKHYPQHCLIDLGHCLP